MFWIPTSPIPHTGGYYAATRKHRHAQRRGAGRGRAESDPPPPAPGLDGPQDGVMLAVGNGGPTTYHNMSDQEPDDEEEIDALAARVAQLEHEVECLKGLGPRVIELEHDQDGFKKRLLYLEAALASHNIK